MGGAGFAGVSHLSPSLILFPAGSKTGPGEREWPKWVGSVPAGDCREAG